MSFYADANATYPVDPAHYDEVARLLKEVDGNPSSIHAQGRAAKVALENARQSVARMFGARATEIIFTSGATEANNLVLQGVLGRVSSQKQTGAESSTRLPHIIITATEHSSVLATARLLEERALCRLSIAPVAKSGAIDVPALLALIDSDTVLVCMMHANNEVGTIHPVQEIAPLIKAKNSTLHLHVDAVQMLGKADITWYAKSTIDSAAVSSHKIGGYKGCGALYLKSGKKLNLLLAGGGQERGRRPGTENLPGILSFGIRCNDLYRLEGKFVAPMTGLKQAWLEALNHIPGAVIHGDPAATLPNTVNFHVEGVPSDDILLNFDLAGIAASSGSACSSGSARPSHVLLAMGYDEWVALNSVRTSFSALGGAGDVHFMTKILKETVMRVRDPGLGKVREL